MKIPKIRGNEVKKTFEDGKRIKTVYFHFIYRKNLSGYTRTMIIIGKRFGNAVKRNRMKRVFREVLRLEKENIISGVDIIILPKNKAMKADFHFLRMVFKDIIKRESLIQI
ncbi:MAG: ribonuclease P protein component [Nitrospirota bacterium]